MSTHVSAFLFSWLLCVSAINTDWQSDGRGDGDWLNFNTPALIMLKDSMHPFRSPYFCQHILVVVTLLSACSGRQFFFFFSRESFSSNDISIINYLLHFHCNEDSRNFIDFLNSIFESYWSWWLNLNLATIFHWSLKIVCISMTCLYSALHLSCVWGCFICSVHIHRMTSLHSDSPISRHCSTGRET